MRYQSRMHPTLDILCDSMGRVFVPQNGKNKAHWTFGCKRKDGYRTVCIDYKTYKVSRLICETFHGLAPADRPTCDHINRDRDCNVPENLRWCNSKQQANNTAHVDRGLEKYGVQRCNDSAAYQRAYYAKTPEFAERQKARGRERYANDPEFAERKRARGRERYAKNREYVRAYQREYYAKQKALRLAAKEN